MPESLYITNMKITQFMGIEFAEVALGPGLNLVTGRNGQGKSSFLKAVPAVMGGEKNSPSHAVKKGARRAEIAAKLSDLRTVVAKWDREQTRKLTLLDANGNPIKKPQDQLNALIGELTFNPLRFLEGDTPADDRRRAETYRQLGGLDFSGMDARKEKLIAERKEVNRALNREKGIVNSMPEYPEAPAKEISYPDLMEKLNECHAQTARNDKVHQAALTAKKAHELAVSTHETRLKYAAKIREQLREAEEAVATALVAVQEKFNASEDAQRAAAGVVTPDVGEIQSKIAEAGAINEKVRANANRKAAEQRVKSFKDEEQGLTDQIDDLEAEKLAKLKAAQEAMPVKGLSIEGDQVLWRGLPLNQASGAEQVDLCVEIGAALNPGLNTILIDDGEKLNADRLARLAEKALEMGIQVIVAKATEGEDAPGIVMEAGKVKGSLVGVTDDTDDFPEF